MNAFRDSTTSEERQLASYRFILTLFQSPILCYHLDCRHIILTQGDAQKQEDLHDFLQWIGAYWPLQTIHLHPEDGAVPPLVQQVLKEHQFLHQALYTKLSLDWLYFVPYLEDIIQQSFLTSFWLLDRVGILMAGKTSSFVTKVSDWPFDDSIFIKIESWPKILNQINDIGKVTEPAEKNTETLPQDTEESATWCRFERELYTAFSTIQILIQENIQRILHVLQDSSQREKNTIQLTLKDYIALYQAYEKEHRSLLRLSPSSLADYHPSVASKRSFSLSAFFNTKRQSAFTFPYESLPATYLASSSFSLSSHTEIQAPFDGFMLPLITQWEKPYNAPQKAVLSSTEQQFILHSLLHPHIGQLSVENLSFSLKGQQNFWFFIEHLLTYNPHITEMTTLTSWEIPQKIHTLLHKNQQWKASLYYASLSKADYEALGLSSTLSDAQNYRKNLIFSYANIALPWVKNTLKHLKPALSAPNYEILKREINENYLPTIQALSAHKKTPPIQASMEYGHVFQSCKPLVEESVSTSEILATTFSFH